MSGWKHKADAVMAAKRLNLKGVHQLENGRWVPGANFDQYFEATRKKPNKKRKNKDKKILSFKK